MSAPPPRRGQGPAGGSEATAQPRSTKRTTFGLGLDPDREPGGWWWPVVCGLVAVVVALAAAIGPLDHAAAAVVVGVAVVSARWHPHRAGALTAVGALGGVMVAALLERPAPLAGVAVAAAAAQLALSPRGLNRLLAAGVLVTAVAGALALRAAEPATIGGGVAGGAAVVLAVAAAAVAALALPAHRGAAIAPTAAVVCAALAVSALGVGEPAIALAAGGLVAALGLGLARRPAAALVAAAVACAATPPASAAAPLALAAAAVAAGLGPSWSRRAVGGADVSEDQRSQPRAWGLPSAAPSGPEADGADAGAAQAGDDEPQRGDRVVDVSVPAWVVSLAALPAGAVVLDAAAGRSAPSVLAVAAVAAAVGLPALLDSAVHDRSGRLPPGACPAAALAALTLVLPNRVGWFGEPVPHWPAGVGIAAVGMALALLPLPRSGRTTPGRGAPAATPSSAPPPHEQEGAGDDAPGSTMRADPVAPSAGRRRGRRKR